MKKESIEEDQEKVVLAERIIEAVQKGSVPTPHYKPELFEDKTYLKRIRDLCKVAVYAIWASERRPTLYRGEIVPAVKAKVDELIKIGEWDAKRWTPPGRDTIIRRLNETADVRFWNGVTPCICLKKRGRYMPNPLLFEEPVRSQIIEIAKEWSGLPRVLRDVEP